MNDILQQAIQALGRVGQTVSNAIPQAVQSLQSGIPALQLPQRIPEAIQSLIDQSQAQKEMIAMRGSTPELLQRAMPMVMGLSFAGGIPGESVNPKVAQLDETINGMNNKYMTASGNAQAGMRPAILDTQDIASQLAHPSGQALAEEEAAKSIAQNRAVLNQRAIENPIPQAPTGVPKELQGLAQLAKQSKDVNDFTAGAIFDRSLTGEETKALDAFQGETTADKLDSFYKSLSSPTGVGGVDEYTASLQKMKAEGRPLMASEQKWLKGDYSSIEPDAKKLYGVTKDPKQSLYIAKDGEMIGNKGNVTEHKDYSMELTGQQADTSLLPKRSGMIETVYSPNKEYNVRIFTQPTPEQIATIKKNASTVPMTFIDDYVHSPAGTKEGTVKGFTGSGKELLDYLKRFESK
jgi:hypothetical protein